MHHRHLLPALLMLISGMLTAAEGMPAGLPYERVVLRDGRQLTGHYDEAQGVLWLDGAGSPRLRVTPDDVTKRTPIVAEQKQRAPANAAPLPTALPSVESQQAAVANFERQLTDLDRRMIETRDEEAKFKAYLQEWLKVYAKAEKIAQADPGTGIGFENNASYNLTKIRSEIRLVRDQLTMQQNMLARQTDRREELLANLRNARQALAAAKADNSTPAVVVYTLESAPHLNGQLEQRIQTLETELRNMQQDNQRLRQILEALTTPTPAPQPQPAQPIPSQSDAANGLVAVVP